MDSTEEYLYHFRRLKALTEEEYENARGCMGGEMLEQYLKMIKIDINELEKKRKTI